MTAFVALLSSLPAGNSTIRMRVWRALKSTGCGVLRDGVYLLPSTAPQSATLVEVESEIRAARGFAMTVELVFKTTAQLDYARALFDRSKDYGTLVTRLNAARAGLKRLGSRKAETLVRRLRLAFDDIAAIDFFAGEARAQANDAMTALEADNLALHSEGEPRSSPRKVRRLDAAKYRNRRWATRKDLWVDRLASIWLIKRFIDRNAKFVWIDRPRDRPKGAIGFDFDGADFTHAGHRVTFEVLIASFGLHEDAALTAMGHTVHFLDIGGIPAPDARGLETVLRGIKAKARSDDELALEASKVFDFIYSAYSEKKEA